MKGSYQMLLCVDIWPPCRGAGPEAQGGLGQRAAGQGGRRQGYRGVGRVCLLLQRRGELDF